jgi:hypothetical protein
VIKGYWTSGVAAVTQADGSVVESHAPSPPEPDPTATFYCAMPNAIPPRGRCAEQCPHCITLDRKE